MFHAVLAAKERTQDRSLKIIQRRLRAVPGRPIIVMRTSRRDNLFRFFKDIQPDNPHVLLYKGNDDFAKAMPADLRSAYEFVRIKGEGLTSASDADSLPMDKLKDAVVVIDVPSGNLPKYENLVEFARALKPCQIVALVGDKFELLSVRPPQAAVEEKLSLRSPEMEPVYLGIHQLPPQTVSSGLAVIQ
jgi:hypothetical protein